MGGSEQHERLRRRRSPVLVPLIVAVIGLAGWIGWTAVANEPAETEPDEPQSPIEHTPLERSTGGTAAEGTFVAETRGPFRFEAQGITMVLESLEGSTRVRAFDDQSLELLWEHESRIANLVPVAQRNESPAGLVLETESSAGGLLSFLDLSGRIVWNQPRRGLVLSGDGGETPSTLVISGSSSPTTLTGRSFESGEAVWSYPTPEGFIGLEATYLGKDRISVTLTGAGPEFEDFAAELDARTGEELWRLKLWRAGEVRAFDGIFFWSGRGRLGRVDPVTEDLLWEVRRGSFDSLVIDGDTVDLGDAGSFDLETGQRRRAPGRSPAG